MTNFQSINSGWHEQTFEEHKHFVPVIENTMKTDQNQIHEYGIYSPITERNSFQETSPKLVTIEPFIEENYNMDTVLFTP